jgi:hypothetical protein
MYGSDLLVVGAKHNMCTTPDPALEGWLVSAFSMSRCPMEPIESPPGDSAVDGSMAGSGAGTPAPAGSALPHRHQPVSALDLERLDLLGYALARQLYGRRRMGDADNGTFMAMP